MAFQSVLFDWRGTLVVHFDTGAWARRALERAGRDVGALQQLVGRIESVQSPVDYLDGPGVDADADLHRSTYVEGLLRAGIDDELVEHLYAVESDPFENPFADDALDVLSTLKAEDRKIGVISNIHFAIRPAFAALEEKAGTSLVDSYSLSFERGVQKPDRAMFEHALHELSADPRTTLMVGDRSEPDGGAVELGVTTLLVPPLTDPRQRRLHNVLRLAL